MSPEQRINVGYRQSDAEDRYDVEVNLEATEAQYSQECKLQSSESSVTARCSLFQPPHPGKIAFCPIGSHVDLLEMQ